MPIGELNGFLDDARRRRREAKELVRSGAMTFAELLEEACFDDPLIGRVRIRVALRWLPHIGPRRRDTVLRETAVLGERRLARLSQSQVDSLLAHRLVRAAMDRAWQSEPTALTLSLDGQRR